MSLDVLTFGCRLNAADSEAIRRDAAAAGLAEAVIVNTCAVTAEATRQARQAIRRARRERPQARIVVTGCAAQAEPAPFAAMAEVDHLIGNAEKASPAAWRAIAAGTQPRVAVGDVFAERAAGPRAVEAFAERTRAFVQVQNGCDHRCTFCIIPFGRGASRSTPPAEVVRLVERLVANGAREAVLTGVDLTAYGADLPERTSLGALVRRVLAEVPGLARLRLSSIDSVEADADLLEALAEEPRLMPHLHLSLQAGDDLILKRMKRRHSHAEAVAFCERARRARPDLVFGADIIVGFPTETEAQFRRSLELVEACGLATVHVFPFSPRPGTPAARMPQVPAATTKVRAARLRAAARAAFARHLAERVGRRDRVLVEKSGFGRIEGFTPARVDPALPTNALLAVRVVGHDGEALLAEAA
jgi:threonylcarbamoyladenosine tRNA methylthiotransferase MtaB